MGYIKLSKKAFFHNLGAIVEKAGSISKVALVLKDNAYGHGLAEIAKLAKEYGIKRAVVRNIDEAKKIKEYFDYILILADLPDEKMDFNFSINQIEDLKKIPKNSKVELKIDTGMHRNGLMPFEIKDAFGIIKKRELLLEGVFTHFRSADELSSELFWQDKVFDEVKKEILKLSSEYNFKIPHFHSCNSAALFRFELMKFIIKFNMFKGNCWFFYDDFCISVFFDCSFLGA
jgi:alanine racemase